MQQVGVAFQLAGVAFCAVDVLQSVGHFQANHQGFHVLPELRAPLIQLAGQQLHLLVRRRSDCVLLQRFDHVINRAGLTALRFEKSAARLRVSSSRS